MENNRERQAKAILAMTKEAVESGNEKLYWEALGYVEGLRRSGEIKDEFAEMVKADITDQWKRQRATMRERFRKLWRFTA